MEVYCSGDYSIDLNDILTKISASDLVESLKENSQLDDILNAIGKDACAKHFNLVEKEKAE